MVVANFLTLQKQPHAGCRETRSICLNRNLHSENKFPTILCRWRSQRRKASTSGTSTKSKAGDEAEQRRKCSVGTIPLDSDTRLRRVLGLLQGGFVDELPIKAPMKFKIPEPAHRQIDWVQFWLGIFRLAGAVGILWLVFTTSG